MGPPHRTSRHRRLTSCSHGVSNVGRVVDRLERLTNLVALLLNTSRPLTLDGIVAEIEGYPAEPEARRQAFERDKRVLRDEGVPLEVTPLPDGGSGYRIAADEYYLTDLEFTDDELVALNLAVAAVHLEGGPGREALWSLGDTPTDDVPALAALPVIDAMPAAVRRLSPAPRQVSFGYRGDTRTLEPWGLLFRDGNWYVTGRDVDRGEARIFRADRISGKVTVGPPGTFTPPEGFDPRRGARRPAVPDRRERAGRGRGRRRSSPRGARHRRCRRRGGGATRCKRRRRPANQRHQPGGSAVVAARVHGPRGRGVARGGARRRREVAQEDGGALAVSPRRVMDHGARLRRLLAIMPWLAARGSATFEEIAERFDLTVDEVERELLLAACCGLPRTRPIGSSSW